jgi:osmotically-inducible protein OsmY
MTPDDYLIGHIREALASDPAVGVLDIQVEISGDTVYLAGSIDCGTKRQAAREAATRVAPNYKIVNNIKVMTLSPVEPPEVLHDSAGGHR